MARRIDWNYTPKRSKWVDPRQKTRRAPSVKDDIRRQNGGFLASEISSGSAPGGQATVKPGPYMDTRLVGRRKWIPERGGMSLRKHWVGRNVPVARDANGRQIAMPDNPSSIGGNPIGGFGTPGASQGRQANGSPIPGALPAYMTYDKRFPGTQNWLKETFGKDAQGRLDESIKGLGPGTTATVTGKGATGVKISREVSPQAVAPGSSRPGNPWDVIRAGIHNQATQWAIGQAGRDNPAFGQGVDLADENDMKAKADQFNGLVDFKKDELAGQFIDNLTKSIQDDIDKNWKPTAPTAAQKAESTAREKVGTGTTTEERKGNLETWNAARRAAHAEEAKRHEQSMKELDDMEKWMKDFAKQNGLKNPTQSAAKGGSAHSLPVSRSEDRFLDDLIGEMEV